MDAILLTVGRRPRYKDHMAKNRTNSGQDRQAPVAGWSSGMTFGFGPKSGGSNPPLATSQEHDFRAICDDIMSRFPKTLAYLRDH